MKQIRQILTKILAVCTLLVLILDAKTAFSGAQEGLRLCIRTLIPSLFPFFVVSGIFCQIFSGNSLTLIRPLCRLCGIPEGTQSLFLMGLLGGYPVGAKNIDDAYKSGSLKLSDAQRMLGFCSNAGPSFLFGIIGPVFHNPFVPWALFLILFLSSVIVGYLLPGHTANKNTNTIHIKQDFKGIFDGSLKAIASVCGWVILFRVILTFLDRWILWLVPESLRVVIAGSLELSNGCIELQEIENEGLRFIVSAAMLTFGGLCVAMQTASVTKSTGLGLYFPGKVLQCFVSLILSYPAQYLLFDEAQTVNILHPALPVIVIILALLARKHHIQKKTVAILG